MTTADFAVRYRSVQEIVAGACDRSGRDPNDVRIVGVSKRHPLSAIRTAAAAGLTTFGESYVQELVEKREELADDLAGCDWHFIGHLQRNKVRALLPHCTMIESVDSERLARRIDREASETGRIMPVLLQVNTSGETSKFGCTPGGASEIATRIDELTSLDLRGCMTMARPTDDPDDTARRSFALLRDVRDLVADRLGRALPELSMGMSGDYAVAIEEGSTLVRIGTDLFGPRP